MSGRTDRSFGQGELFGADGIEPDPVELAAVMAIAGELDRVAAEPSARPSAGFVDRVSIVIASEPRPAPVVAALQSLRRGSPLSFLGALRDSGRVAFGAGRPAAVRGPALALLLAALLVTISLGGATALAASHLIAPGPMPTQVAATATPPISPTPTYSESPVRTLHPGPTTAAGESGDPAQQGSGPRAEPTEPLRPSASPSDRLRPGESPEPSRTPDPDEDELARPSNSPSH